MENFWREKTDTAEKCSLINYKKKQQNWIFMGIFRHGHLTIIPFNFEDKKDA